MTASRAGSAAGGERTDTRLKANSVTQTHESQLIDSLRVSRQDRDSGRYGRYRPLSRSPSPYRADRSRDNLPHRASRRNEPSRSRSPSPFRHAHRSGGGNGNSNSRSYNKRKTSPPYNDRADKRINRLDSSFDEIRMEARRNYPRSRSGQIDFVAERKDVAKPAFGKPISYAEIEHPKAVPDFKNGMPFKDRYQHPSGRNEQRGKERAMPNGQNGDKPGAGRPQKSEEKEHGVGAYADVPSDNTTVAEHSDRKLVDDDTDYVPIVEEEKVPTQESREEKRRRWAAKRAAAADKENNLLQKAVLSNASEVMTPSVASPGSLAEVSVSPFPSPKTAEPDSAPASPASPVAVIKQKRIDASPANSPAPDSPSAADYDPTQDMLDDRARAAKKDQNTEVSSNAYSETNPKALSTLPAAKVAPVKKQKKELDMFASSDEEDNDEAEEEPDVAKGNILHENMLDNWDDREGYYKLISNELINNGRFRVIRPLGRGVFANVAQAEDVKVAANDPHRLVAIKIIRKNDVMKKASQKEMEFLRKVNEADPHDTHHVVRLLSHFDHKGHLCIVFEHMSKNLRDLLKEDASGHGLNLGAVRRYAKQMFLGLQHLQDCDVIHLDLKPDNVLVSLDKLTVKLADFGTAVDQRNPMEPTQYLVSRFYRAPEIILGMEVSYPADLWAIGCTIYELWTGKILFTGRSNNQMVKAFIDCLGWPSEKLLRKADPEIIRLHFEASSTLQFRSLEVDQDNKPIIRMIDQQKKVTRDLRTRVHDGAKDISTNAKERPKVIELNDLTDLLAACLHINIEKRITPKEALAHKFFDTKNTVKPASRTQEHTGTTRPGPSGFR